MTRIPLPLSIAALALVPSLPAPAAPLVPLSQERSVNLDQRHFWNVWSNEANPFFPDFDPPTVSILVGSQVPSAAASDFGPFSESVSTTLGSVAHQSSRIERGWVEASGSLWGLVNSSTCTDWIPTNYCTFSRQFTGDSSFSVTFSLDENTPYVLTGSAQHSPTFGQTFGAIDGTAEIRLTGPSGVIAEVVAPDSFCPDLPDCLSDAVPLLDSGSLAAGTYTLEAFATGSGFGACLDVGGGVTCFSGAGGGSYSVRLALDGLAPPVPALGAAPAALLAAALLLGGALASAALRRRA